MLSPEDHKLEVERAKGDDYQRVWDQKVGPFCEAKKAELFDAFINLPPTSEKELVVLKMMANAIQSLEEEFKSFINTGKLASTKLEEKNDG